MEKSAPIAEIRINSLGDLIDAVTPAEPDAKTGRRRDAGVYRGMPDPDWPLLTSLDQLGGVNPRGSKPRAQSSAFVRTTGVLSPTS
jgi:hypothetical protein